MAVKQFKNPNAPLKWKQFKGDIILWLVNWYCRYALSYNDLKEMVAECDLFVERLTIYRWVHEYAAEINKRVKPYLKRVSDSWRVDETYVKIKGKWHYLYRAIDKKGNTLDWMLSRHRNKKAAKQFFKKILVNPHISQPRVINVDKNPAFLPAHNELQREEELSKRTKLRQVKYLNNSVENDHKFTKRKSRYRQWYQAFETAKYTIDGMETMRMIKKGQIKYLAKGDVRAQNDFLFKLFNLAA